MRVVAWQDRAACRKVAPEVADLFVSRSEGTDNTDPTMGPVDDEAWAPSPVTAAYCLPCPVGVECLAYAQQKDAWGTWAWTSRHQRRQLKRRRRRAFCPRCGEAGPTDLPGTQVCLACGISWSAPPPRPH
jgi:Transcription factor WhiB